MTDRLRKSMLPAAQVGVLIGPAIDFSAAKVSADGLPTAIQIFPYPTYTNDEGTFITDDESQALIIADFRERGNVLVIDYEHQTLKDVEAPAAGYITDLRAGGSEGLIGEPLEWTKKGADYVRKIDGYAAEYRQHSPVFWWDKATRRIFALHSVALTNAPKSHNQKALHEQVAAKAMLDYELMLAKSEGGHMNWLNEVRWFLGLPLTTTGPEARAALQKIMDALPTEDTLSAAKATIAAAKNDAGEAIEITDDTKIATLVSATIGTTEVAAAEPPAEAVAAAEVLAALEVPADATKAVVVAKVLSLQHPSDMVAREEYDAVVAKLAAVDTETKQKSIDQLIEANRSKLPPSKAKLEEKIRKIAETDFAFAKETLDAMETVLPSSSQAESAPAAKKVASVASRRKVGDGEELAVEPTSAERAAAVRSFMAETGEKDYAAASLAYAKRQREQSAAE